MKIKLWLLLSLFALVFSMGCKKDAEPKTTLDLLTQSAWWLHEYGNDADNNGTIDDPLPSYLVPACKTDGSLTLNRDGKGFSDEGATKCSPGMPQTVPFDWSLKNNETVINFSFVTFFGFIGDVKIIHLSDSSLTLAGQVAHFAEVYDAIMIFKN